MLTFSCSPLSLFQGIKGKGGGDSKSQSTCVTTTITYKGKKGGEKREDGE